MLTDFETLLCALLVLIYLKHLYVSCHTGSVIYLYVFLSYWNVVGAWVKTKNFGHWILHANHSASHRYTDFDKNLLNWNSCLQISSKPITYLQKLLGKKIFFVNSCMLYCFLNRKVLRFVSWINYLFTSTSQCSNGTVKCDELATPSTGKI